MTRLIPVDREFLLELACYFDDRSDVRDGPYGEPVANREMQLLQQVQELIDADDRASKAGLWNLAKELMRR